MLVEKANKLVKYFFVIIHNYDWNMKIIITINTMIMDAWSQGFLNLLILTSTHAQINFISQLKNLKYQIIECISFFLSIIETFYTLVFEIITAHCNSYLLFFTSLLYVQFFKTFNAW